MLRRRLFDHALDRRLSEQEAAVVLKQVARALRYLHRSRKMVHRDLKLENVLLAKAGVGIGATPVKVIDFGLASQCPDDKDNVLKDQCGTLYYLAPELLQETGYGRPLDIWTCGVMVFVMLYGMFPFASNKGEEETVDRIISAPLSFPSVRTVKVQVSTQARAIVRRMLDRRVALRPTAEAILADAWVTKNAPNKEPKLLTSEHCGRLLRSIELVNRAPLATVAYQLIVLRLSEAEVRDIKDLFLSLDVSGLGYITEQEIAAGLEAAGLVDTEDGKLLLASLNGYLSASEGSALSYTEFLAAVIDKSAATPDRCRMAFRVFDRKMDGIIDVEELRVVMPSQGPELLKQWSVQNGGGETMPYQAFCELLSVTDVGAPWTLKREPSKCCPCLVRGPQRIVANVDATSKFGD
mmetsp:Transcript_9031/g.19739  ORF Transcript_9031/g.19739 Transcript_9031/m.19739 type:complete len:409 (+) Transcript_9031:518-1744(+)